MTFGQRLGTGFFPVITLELPVWRESELEHDLSALWRRINAAQRHGGFLSFYSFELSENPQLNFYMY